LVLKEFGLEKQVAVVILNWNGRKFLEQFLPSVLDHSLEEARIIVADNASTDDSLAWLAVHYPQVEIIVNSKNYGFSQGYNEALKQVDARYYVLLNSDIEVTPGWITPLIRLMESDPQIAACQPKLRSWHDKTSFEYAGGAGGFIDNLGYPFCRGRLFQTLEKDEGQYDDQQEIFWATGACMFVRASLYHEYGGLDNDFFAHMEEIDFCWRLKNAGYKIMYSPESTVYHVGGGTLPKSSSRKTFLNFRNNLILLYKNLPPAEIPRVFILRFVLDIIASLKFLTEGFWKDYWAVFRAYIAFYTSLPTNKIKRSGIPHRKVTGIYSGSLVWAYYIKGKRKFSELHNSNW